MAYAPHANGNVAPAWVMGRQLTPYGIASDSAGRIYVTDYWLDSISVFAPDAAGAASPVATIRGSKTGLQFPTGIAVDSKGKIYALNAAGEVTEAPGPGDQVRIDVYAAGSNGNVAPTAVIVGHRTRLENPKAIAVDSSDKIYVADEGGDDDPNSPPRVMVYEAGSKGDIAPIATISGGKTGLDNPDGIAVESSGKIYVTNNGSESRDTDTITVYPPAAHGNVAPVATIGSETEPQGIAVDSAGKIYVTNRVDWRHQKFGLQKFDPHLAQSVRVYAANANGDEAEPIAIIQGLQTGMDEVEGVMVGRKGEIYVASCPLSKSGTVTVYPANSNGDVKPRATIADGADTELDLPRAIAVDPSGQIYVANTESITIYPPGTNHNVPPIRAITGPRYMFINTPDGIALDSDENIYLSIAQGGSLNNGVVDVFAAGSNGKATPSAIISFTNTRSPTSVAVDSAGNLHVDGWGGRPGGKNSIYIYPPDSHGVALPLATIEGVNAGGIALDRLGRIYVANGGAVPSDRGSVDIYPGLSMPGYKPGAPAQISLLTQPGYPDVRPVATISGARSGIDHPQAIAVDYLGRIYVLNSETPGLPGSGSITVYGGLPDLLNGSNFSQTPIATIAGPDTKLDMSPMGIAVWEPPSP
jgi:sugar lactone lactonase YvrE